MVLVAQAEYVQWCTGSRLYTLEDETRSSFTKSEAHYPCNAEFHPQLHGRGGLTTRNKHYEAESFTETSACYKVPDCTWDLHVVTIDI